MDEFFEHETDDKEIKATLHYYVCLSPGRITRYCKEVVDHWDFTPRLSASIPKPSALRLNHHHHPSHTIL
jgi:hypothetical protein